MWLYNNNNPPNYLAQNVISHQSNYTNSRNNLYVPRPRLDLLKTSISFAGASFWNSLPQNIKPCICLPCFQLIPTNICLRITFRQIWSDLFESHACLQMCRNIRIKFVSWAYMSTTLRYLSKRVIQTNPSKFDERLFSDIYLCRLHWKQGTEIHDFIF